MPDRQRTVIVNAADVRHLITAMRNDEPVIVKLMDGTRIELVAGDPVTGQVGREYAGLDDLPTLD